MIAINSYKLQRAPYQQRSIDSLFLVGGLMIWLSQSEAFAP